jgi:hypothetical protein
MVLKIHTAALRFMTTCSLTVGKKLHGKKSVLRWSSGIIVPEDGDIFFPNVGKHPSDSTAA